MSRSQGSQGQRVAGEQAGLVALGRQFARFRKEYPRGTRVPDLGAHQKPATSARQKSAMSETRRGAATGGASFLEDGRRSA